MNLEQAKIAVSKLENVVEYISCLQWEIDIDDEQYNAFGKKVNVTLLDMRCLISSLKDFYNID